MTSGWSPTSFGPPSRRLSAEHAALGEAVRERRVNAGLSQEGLAARGGLHRTYVGGIERGERNVSYANLLRIATALHTRASQLIARAEALTRHT